jgi:hypothetical protein
MNSTPPPRSSFAEDRKRRSRALLWLFIFLYVPFVFAHGVNCLTEPAVDFPPLYSATKVAFDRHQSPYGERAFDEQSLALGRPVPPYIYPPPSLLVLWPLHLFSYDTAKALMLAVNHLCLLAAIALIFRRLFREELACAPNQLTAALVMTYILLFDPTVVTLHLGQVNLLLLVCVVLAWDALKRNGSALAIAAPLTIAIVIKTYPALLVALLILRKRYAAAALTVGLFAVACAVSFAVLPHGMWHDWAVNVLPMSAEPHAGPWNQNIRAFLARALVPNAFCEPLVSARTFAMPLINALSLAVMAATLWVSFRCWRLPNSRREIDFQMSLFLCMIFLIAPVSWEHHFVYLLPSIVLILLLLLEGEIRGQWRWITALSLCLVAWKLPITAEWLRKGPATLAISAKFYPAVALWIFFVVRTRQIGSTADVEEIDASTVASQPSVARAART